MYKSIFTAALLATSLNANSSIILNSGESFSSSFSLISVGEAFKPTDFYWDAGILMSFTSPSANVSFTAYENTDFSGEFFSSEIFAPSSTERNYLGSYASAFDDKEGSFRITNNGTAQIELFDIIISNFSGSLLPSNIATTTITPSAVPVPAAIWLFTSGIVGLVGVGRLKRKH